MILWKNHMENRKLIFHMKSECSIPVRGRWLF